MKGVSIHGLFCDDIRQEIGGKTSLMGCYHGDLLVPKFPATVHQLCFFGRLILPDDVRLEEDISLVMSAGDTVLLEGSISSASIPDPSDANRKDQSSVRVVAIELIARPARLKQPCVIAVVAKIGARELRPLALKVGAGDPMKFSVPILETRNRKVT